MKTKVWKTTIEAPPLPGMDDPPGQKRTAKNLSLNVVDAKEQELFDLDRSLLETLLLDRSNVKPSDKGKCLHIRWCTDEYEQRGTGFGPGDPIRVDLVTGKNRETIRPRAAKPADDRRRRVRESAEVFTPSWICNAQNNLVDAAWFGRRTSLFNTETERGWKPTTATVRFSGGRTWEQYATAIRLEAACGEAPYLTSRYDTVTNEPIPVERRIGLLDRKLRVITENVREPVPWRDWALRAVRSVYGFDYQGDNVLLARENVLYAVFETYAAAFGSLDWAIPDILPFATAVSWNIWQMDGLTGRIPDVRPLRPPEEADWPPADPDSFSLFADPAPRTPPPLCKIKDWSLGDRAAPIPFNRLRDLPAGE